MASGLTASAVPAAASAFVDPIDDAAKPNPGTEMTAAAAAAAADAAAADASSQAVIWSTDAPTPMPTSTAATAEEEAEAPSKEEEEKSHQPQSAAERCPGHQPRAKFGDVFNISQRRPTEEERRQEELAAFFSSQPNLDESTALRVVAEVKAASQEEKKQEEQQQQEQSTSPSLSSSEEEEPEEEDEDTSDVEDASDLVEPTKNSSATMRFVAELRAARVAKAADRADGGGSTSPLRNDEIERVALKVGIPGTQVGRPQESGKDHAESNGDDEDVDGRPPESGKDPPRSMVDVNSPMGSNDDEDEEDVAPWWADDDGDGPVVGSSEWCAQQREAKLAAKGGAKVNNKAKRKNGSSPNNSSSTAFESPKDGNGVVNLVDGETETEDSDDDGGVEYIAQLPKCYRMPPVLPQMAIRWPERYAKKRRVVSAKGGPRKKAKEAKSGDEKSPTENGAGFTRVYDKSPDKAVRPIPTHDLLPKHATTPAAGKSTETKQTLVGSAEVGKQKTPGSKRIPAKLISEQPAPTVGPGWTMKTYERQSGETAGTRDSYWFSPRAKKKFRSLKEIGRFVEILKGIEGGEKRAGDNGDGTVAGVGGGAAAGGAIEGKELDGDEEEGKRREQEAWKLFRTKPTSAKKVKRVDEQVPAAQVVPPNVT